MFRYCIYGRVLHTLKITEDFRIGFDGGVLSNVCFVLQHQAVHDFEVSQSHLVNDGLNVVFSGARHLDNGWRVCG